MAKWEDTVMSPFQLDIVWKEPLIDSKDRHDLHIAKAQAEITWHSRDKEVEEAEQRGIQKALGEVRSLMMKQRDACAPDKYSLVLVTDEERWQAFLKGERK